MLILYLIIFRLFSMSLEYDVLTGYCDACFQLYDYTDAGRIRSKSVDNIN